MRHGSQVPGSSTPLNAPVIGRVELSGGLLHGLCADRVESEAAQNCEEASEMRVRKAKLTSLTGTASENGKQRKTADVVAFRTANSKRLPSPANPILQTYPFLFCILSPLSLLRGGRNSRPDVNRPPQAFLKCSPSPETQRHQQQPVHVTVYPPSTLRSAPVTYADASDSKKVTGPIRSAGAPMRPWGMSEVHWRLRAGLSSRIFWVLFLGLELASPLFCASLRPSLCPSLSLFLSLNFPTQPLPVCGWQVEEGSTGRAR